MNFDSKAKCRKKSFSFETKAPTLFSQWGEHALVPNQEKIEIITTILVCLIWMMNFDFKENGGKKSISYKTKASISCTEWGEHIYGAKSERKVYYYKNPCSSNLRDEL